VHDLFDEPYYVAASAPPRLPGSQAEQRVMEVLRDRARETVVETVKRWNQALRTEVRAATALSLPDGASVPVAVVDGMPKPLADATAHIETWQWWLAFHRPTLEQTDHNLGFLLNERDFLTHHLGDAARNMDSVSSSRSLIQNVLKHSTEKNIFECFKKIEQDVFGAYWILASRIQLYWMPRVALSALAAAVLCHELVHAYTHRGVDTNGESWATSHFIKTDVYVKEGLAQYYTEQIMQSLRDRLPDGLEAFLKKTSRQSAPYTAYQNWLGDKKQPSPEAVRLAMLQFRNSKSPIHDHESFSGLLHSAQAQIRGGRSGEQNPSASV
jgi:hypothetical protein